MSNLVRFSSIGSHICSMLKIFILLLLSLSDYLYEKKAFKTDKFS